MSKKEKELVEELYTLNALRFTEKVLPDVLPPEYFSEVKIHNVYLYNAYIIRVTEACTSSIAHSTSTHNITTSQNPRALYSDRIRALKAMRNEVEMECAKKLRSIDKMIEKEQISIQEVKETKD